MTKSETIKKYRALWNYIAANNLSDEHEAVKLLFNTTMVHDNPCCEYALKASGHESADYIESAEICQKCPINWNPLDKSTKDLTCGGKHSPYLKWCEAIEQNDLVLMTRYARRMANLPEKS